MPASIIITEPQVEVEPDESEQRPMTDREHLATFGWAWDDPTGEASA